MVMLALELMKLRSATPVLTSFAAKAVLLLAAILMMVATPIQMATVAKADEFDDRINAIQREIDQYQAEAGKLRNQANNLQAKLNGLSNEKAQIQARINLNQAQYDKLQAQIKKTEQDIENNKGALGDTIANIYVDGNISPLEMLASSKNIGDYVDKQEYQSSISDELTKAIRTIKTLKKQLEKQKSDVEAVLSNQKRARDALSAKEAEQQSLISQTKGKENAYQQLSSKSEQQKLLIQQEQQAAIAAASNNNGGVKFVGGSSGGYPWTSSNCYVDAFAMSHGGSDGNGGDGWGYGCRQCASYAAWKIGQRTGTIPTDLGNAKDFPYSYSNKGGSARANSVGVISAGQYGHVVWVETNPDANGNIIVSQYNANYSGSPSNWGNYTRVQVHQSTYDTFIYF